MISVKQTNLYSEVLKELNYSFGDIFIFEGFIVSEIKQGINFSWNNHAKQIVEDVSCFLGTDGRDLVYISNRINTYAVVAIDWLKFFKNQYSLKGYYVVSNSKFSLMNLMVEELFFRNKIKNFKSIYSAVNWTKKGSAIVA
ncbi:hypothetical protein GCM10023311_02290 [Flaviramulus aquimarinus]|uniref:STAS/SEC14 domain-containing protein n=1 Tax=Flaviramulus aquimarinus TaxID=1170456 RepID=A0ABP9ENH4_9FLAO